MILYQHTQNKKLYIIESSKEGRVAWPYLKNGKIIISPKIEEFTIISYISNV